MSTTNVSIPESAKSTARRSLVPELVLLVATVLLCCLALEAGLRIVYRHSHDFSMEMWKYAVALKRPVSNPDLSFAHAPGKSAFLMGVPVSINSHGLRDREFSQTKAAGVYRIVTLGDSTTFGWGVPESQTVAKILEREMNRSGLAGYRSVEVLNAGVGNYDTVQEYNHYLTFDRAFHPDLVILEYFINDPEPVPSEKRMWLLGSSYLAAFVASRYDATLRYLGVLPNWESYYSNLYSDRNPGYARAKDALVKLANATRADHARLLVTILPELHQINASYPFAQEQQGIKDVLARNQIPCIDLLDGLRNHGPEQTLWVTPADDHPNGKANSLIVAQIKPWIVQQAATPQ